ncbi:hydrolytic protein [Streptomyces carminius]|uniref:Hydrolytic protein n=1 Tax=Streptomyces carminius TaxID=2665496 RepID=A0A2M8MC84_9ACTN|nr:hydrolytic protein [Streptomyces carminius]PJE97974.1 hydrolytic protein [Streptomyces carminius]PJF01800.1 hydrolytic protein [Streptomyces carminius]
MSTTAHVDHSSVSVAPGDERHVVLNVRNSGDIVESYGFTVVGDTAEWTAVEPRTLSLYPGTEGTVTLVFRPPRSPEVRAGEVPYAVRVLPSERPGGAVVPEGRVTVLPFRELAAEVLPAQRKRRLRARFQLRVANLGNTPVSVLLSAEGASEEVGHSLSAETLTLEPGEETFTDLTARSRKLLWFGAAVPHPFEARVRGEDEEEPVTAEGVYVQQPVLPYWLLALLALLIALLLLWFTLVLPSVRSAAREQADAAIEEATDTSGLPSPSASGGQDGGPGGGAADGGAGPGGSGGEGQTDGGGSTGRQGGTGGGSAREGGGVEFATVLETRVSPGGSDRQVFRVPDDRMLLITDIVADAPQGDTGTLRVTIDDRTVTSLALENFRSYDNHWVTPIEAPPGSEIVMTVTCRRPGSPPDAPPPGTCAESVFVNGTSVPFSSASPDGG